MSRSCAWIIVAAICTTAAGCMTIRSPGVEQAVTTGETLRAIAAARATEVAATKGDHDSELVGGWYDALRARVVSQPPSMRAGIYTYREDLVPADYGTSNPAFYTPLDRERADLDRALRAGAVTSAEFAELSASLTAQAARPIVRRSTEMTPPRLPPRHWDWRGEPVNYTAEGRAEYLSSFWVPMWIDRYRELAKLQASLPAVSDPAYMAKAAYLERKTRGLHESNPNLPPNLPDHASATAMLMAPRVTGK